MSEELRTWGPTEVAPDDATGEELSLHLLLWGDVFVLVDPDESYPRED